MWKISLKILKIFALILSVSGGFEENSFMKPEDYAEDEKILPVFENDFNKRGSFGSKKLLTFLFISTARNWPLAVCFFIVAYICFFFFILYKPSVYLFFRHFS